MRSREPVNYLSVEEIELRAVDQLRTAAELPPGIERSTAFKSAVQLRSYAAMKRLLVPSPARLASNLKVR